MTTVQDILDFLEALCPMRYKIEWDHTGLQLGSRNKPVKNVLLALDPFPHVCKEAVDTGADLLLTHHPLIFNPTDSITDDNSVGCAALTLAESGIVSISAHTHLDCAPGGINDTLAKLLGLADIKTVDCDPDHLLRQGTLETQSLQEFMGRVKAVLGTPVLRYADGGKPVSKVIVGGGSCGTEWHLAKEAGCDTFLTSDVKYNQFWNAKDAGMSIIDAGHFYTENPIIPVLADKLQEAFPELIVKISKTHRDCMKFYG